jgi:hypothetical protein
VQGSRVRLGGIPLSLSGMLLCDCVLDGAG